MREPGRQSAVEDGLLTNQNGRHSGTARSAGPGTHEHGPPPIRAMPAASWKSRCSWVPVCWVCGKVVRAGDRWVPDRPDRFPARSPPAYRLTHPEQLIEAAATDLAAQEQAR